MLYLSLEKRVLPKEFDNKIVESLRTILSEKSRIYKESISKDLEYLKKINNIKLKEERLIIDYISEDEFKILEKHKGKLLNSDRIYGSLPDDISGFDKCFLADRFFYLKEEIKKTEVRISGNKGCLKYIEEIFQLLTKNRS